jgi:hypothetical protein
MYNEVAMLFELANEHSIRSAKLAPADIQECMADQLRVVLAWRKRVLKEVEAHTEPEA